MRVKNCDTVQTAVLKRLTPDKDSYPGKLECLEAKIEMLQDTVSMLIDCIYGSSQDLSKVNQLTNILDYSYYVEE